MPRLSTTLKGTITFTSDRKGFKKPMKKEVSVPFTFSVDRKTADASGLQPIIVGPFAVEVTDAEAFLLAIVGEKPENTLTVRRKSGGKGTLDPATGAMAIPITLVFEHSLPLPPSELKLTLTTGAVPGGPTGAAVKPARGGGASVKLVATGRFRTGHLDGNSGTATIKGRFDDNPRALP